MYFIYHYCLVGVLRTKTTKELAWAIYTQILVKPEHAIPLNDLLGSIGQYIGLSTSKKNENTTSEEWKELYRRLL